jgi:transposase
MAKSSTRCAGIDTGKRKLDVALAADGKPVDSERLRVDNGPSGHAELSQWLRRHRIERVGIEASGGYEGPVVAALRRDGFVVVVCSQRRCAPMASSCCGGPRTTASTRP